MPRNEQVLASLRIAFGETTRELRLEQGIAQETLAHLAGVDRAYMGMLERAVHTPSIEVVHRVICGLNIPALTFWARYYAIYEKVRRRRKHPACPGK